VRVAFASAARQHSAVPAMLERLHEALASHAREKIPRACRRHSQADEVAAERSSACRSAGELAAGTSSPTAWPERRLRVRAQPLPPRLVVSCERFAVSKRLQSRPWQRRHTGQNVWKRPPTDPSADGFALRGGNTTQSRVRGREGRGVRHQQGESLLLVLRNAIRFQWKTIQNGRTSRRRSGARRFAEPERSFCQRGIPSVKLRDHGLLASEAPRAEPPASSNAPPADWALTGGARARHTGEPAPAASRPLSLHQASHNSRRRW